jgi:4-amino-4-deoxy-L-arabinose transferase-like glycosyltransferase
MGKTDRIALLLSLAAIAAAYLVAEFVFERIPHIEDEMAFVWQAQVYARGQVTIPSPPHSNIMMTPFVVDYHGQRFSKFPPGWSVMLAFGYLLGARAWVNPLLAGLAVWLTYRLGQKVFNPAVGLLAAFLTLLSPFFLILSGSLLSHTWSLVLSLTFALAWLDTFVYGSSPSYHYETPVPRWMTSLVAGLTLGLLALTRPLTALGVALPFFIHGLVLLWRGGWDVRRRVLLIGMVALLVSALFLLWQYALTGSPFTNPYTLWWPYDKIGFSPTVGRQEGGHNLFWSLISLKKALETGWSDFFGWGDLSWLFLPLGLWAARRNRPAWLVGSVFVSLAGAYMLYWTSSTTFGPRYYFEGFYSVTLLSAAGFLWLVGWSKAKSWRSRRFLVAAGLLAFLVSYNLLLYLPARMQGMRGLYGVERTDLLPFQTEEAKALTPAIVVVHILDTWTDYGALLDLQDPWLTTPFIFTFGQGGVPDAAIKADFPNRRLIHYYPDEPYTFYEHPRGK